MVTSFAWLASATATVSRQGADFLGTCFAFRRRDVYLTAAHCVGALDASEVVVVYTMNRPATRLPVLEVVRHPYADMALLRVDASATQLRFEPFRDHATSTAAGEEFVAFGFPEDVLGPDARKPTARIFRGHFQRFYGHTSEVTGRWYVAGEMSIPAPAGLSGGPVCRPNAPHVLTGLVAENRESYTTLEAVEEVTGAGPRTIEARSVVTYGVAVALDYMGDWLNQHVPPR